VDEYQLSKINFAIKKLREANESLAKGHHYHYGEDWFEDALDKTCDAIRELQDVLRCNDT
jgi:hypothetical protein